jgi:hypothetical protein
MSDYVPDKWVIVKITDDKNEHPTIYKIFACWYGGYAGSDSWKLNSGITRVSKEGYVYSFEGSSGSVYECHEDSYGMNFYGGGVLMNMRETAAKNGITIEILDENVDPMTLIYE